MVGKTGKNPAVGCVVIKKNELVGIGATSQGGRPHAEENALSMAGKNASGSTMYVTLEPCAMCAMAISLVGIKNLYFATEDKKKGCVENGIRIFSSNSCHHEPNVFNGFYKKESDVLLKKFFSQRR